MATERTPSFGILKLSFAPAEKRPRVKDRVIPATRWNASSELPRFLEEASKPCEDLDEVRLSKILPDRPLRGLFGLVTAADESRLALVAAAETEVGSCKAFAPTISIVAWLAARAAWEKELALI